MLFSCFFTFQVSAKFSLPFCSLNVQGSRAIEKGKGALSRSSEPSSFVLLSFRSCFVALCYPLQCVSSSGLFCSSTSFTFSSRILRFSLFSVAHAYLSVANNRPLLKPIPLQSITKIYFSMSWLLIVDCLRLSWTVCAIRAGLVGTLFRARRESLERQV